MPMWSSWLATSTSALGASSGLGKHFTAQCYTCLAIMSFTAAISPRHFRRCGMRDAGDERIIILDRDEVVIKGVRFLGATMWTDFAATGNSRLAALSAQQELSDFRKIRTDNYRRIRPADLIEQAKKTHDWLKGKLSEPHNGPTVVITHHAPTLLSLEENPHAGTILDAAFANDWEHLMGGDRVALWIHGHTHTSVDFELNGTRIISNQRGYPREESGFQPFLVIDL